MIITFFLIFHSLKWNGSNALTASLRSALESAGEDITSLLLAGRWQSESSLRVYADVIAACGNAKLQLVDRRGGLVVGHLRESCPAASAWRENVRQQTLLAGVSGRAAEHISLCGNSYTERDQAHFSSLRVVSKRREV